jgi:hypothetical protein
MPTTAPRRLRVDAWSRGTEALRLVGVTASQAAVAILRAHRSSRGAANSEKSPHDVASGVDPHRTGGDTTGDANSGEHAFAQQKAMRA